MIYATDLLPHGVCWQWDWTLILMHSPSDLLTFLAYMTIPAIVIYIYQKGHLSRIYTAYPSLWRLGAGFVFFCGLSHMFAFLEIWFGGWIYYLSGANKIIMAVVSMLFAAKFWKSRRELAMISSAISNSMDRFIGSRGL